MWNKISCAITNTCWKLSIRDILDGPVVIKNWYEVHSLAMHPDTLGIYTIAVVIVLYILPVGDSTTM